MFGLFPVIIYCRVIYIHMQYYNTCMYTCMCKYCTKKFKINFYFYESFCLIKFHFAVHEYKNTLTNYSNCLIRERKTK